MNPDIALSDTESDGSLQCSHENQPESIPSISPHTPTATAIDNATQRVLCFAAEDATFSPIGSLCLHHAYFEL